uniref:Uncharacterized protein n=1 Tax=Meloidogyne hapla TaxID=6305 RepID=A0A1I8B791_MELHA
MAFQLDQSKSSPPLRISFNMDIRTNGAKEGLLISTGIISGTPQMFNGIFGVNNNSSLWPAVFSPTDKTQTTSIATLPLNDKNNVELLNKNLNNSLNEQSKMLSPLMLSINEGEEKKQQPENQKQLNNFHCFPNPSKTNKNDDCCSPPLLFASTTTTTSLEIFRPESASSSNADFYQLPKAPLSREKIREPPVVLVPAKGEEYEFREKSETHFSTESANTLNYKKSPPLQQKSVHWGESICIQPSPIPSTSTTPSSSSSLPSSSNSFHCSQRFPIQMEEIKETFINDNQHKEDSFVSSPFPKQINQFPDNQPITSPTIIRRQCQQHFEKRLSNSPSPECQKCPPIPPKKFNKNYQNIWENSVPPLPPKPEHLRINKNLLNQNLHQR